MYQEKTSCNYCGGESDITDVTDSMGGWVHECKTKCKEPNCGEEDYWAYGFFESSQHIISKCKTY